MYPPAFLFTSHSVSRLITRHSDNWSRTRLRAASTFVLMSNVVRQILIELGWTVHSLSEGSAVDVVNWQRSSSSRCFIFNDGIAPWKKALSSIGLSVVSRWGMPWPYARSVSKSVSIWFVIWSCPSVTTWNWTRISPTWLVAVISALKIDSPWYCPRCFASL